MSNSLLAQDTQSGPSDDGVSVAGPSNTSSASNTFPASRQPVANASVTHLTVKSGLYVLDDDLLARYPGKTSVEALDLLLADGVTGTQLKCRRNPSFVPASASTRRSATSRLRRQAEPVVQTEGERAKRDANSVAGTSRTPSPATTLADNDAVTPPAPSSFATQGSYTMPYPSPVPTGYLSLPDWERMRATLRAEHDANYAKTQAAVDAAYIKGLTAGREEGYSAGYADGHATGLERGRALGTAEAHAEASFVRSQAPSPCQAPETPASKPPCPPSPRTPCTPATPTTPATAKSSRAEQYRRDNRAILASVQAIRDDVIPALSGLESRVMAVEKVQEAIKAELEAIMVKVSAVAVVKEEPAPPAQATPAPVVSPVKTPAKECPNQVTPRKAGSVVEQATPVTPTPRKTGGAEQALPVSSTPRRGLRRLSLVDGPRSPIKPKTPPPKPATSDNDGPNPRSGPLRPPKEMPEATLRRSMGYLQSSIGKELKTLKKGLEEAQVRLVEGQKLIDRLVKKNGAYSRRNEWPPEDVEEFAFAAEQMGSDDQVLKALKWRIARIQSLNEAARKAFYRRKALNEAADAAPHTPLPPSPTSTSRGNEASADEAASPSRGHRRGIPVNWRRQEATPVASDAEHSEVDYTGADITADGFLDGSFFDDSILDGSFMNDAGTAQADESFSPEDKALADALVEELDKSYVDTTFVEASFADATADERMFLQVPHWTKAKRNTPDAEEAAMDAAFEEMAEALDLVEDETNAAKISQARGTVSDGGKTEDEGDGEHTAVPSDEETVKAGVADEPDAVERPPSPAVPSIRVTSPTPSPLSLAQISVHDSDDESDDDETRFARSRILTTPTRGEFRWSQDAHRSWATEEPSDSDSDDEAPAAASASAVGVPSESTAEEAASTEAVEDAKPQMKSPVAPEEQDDEVFEEENSQFCPVLGEILPKPNSDETFEEEDSQYCPVLGENLPKPKSEETFEEEDSQFCPVLGEIIPKTEAAETFEEEDSQFCPVLGMVLPKPDAVDDADGDVECEEKVEVVDEGTTGAGDQQVAQDGVKNEEPSSAAADTPDEAASTLNVDAGAQVETIPAAPLDEAEIERVETIPADKAIAAPQLDNVTTATTTAEVVSEETATQVENYPADHLQSLVVSELGTQPAAEQLDEFAFWPTAVPANDVAVSTPVAAVPAIIVQPPTPASVDRAPQGSEDKSGIQVPPSAETTTTAPSDVPVLVAEESAPTPSSSSPPPLVAPPPTTSAFANVSFGNFAASFGKAAATPASEENSGAGRPTRSMSSNRRGNRQQQKPKRDRPGRVVSDDTSSSSASNDMGATTQAEMLARLWAPVAEEEAENVSAQAEVLAWPQPTPESTPEPTSKPVSGLFAGVKFPGLALPGASTPKEVGPVAQGNVFVDIAPAPAPEAFASLPVSDAVEPTSSGADLLSRLGPVVAPDESAHNNAVIVPVVSEAVFPSEPVAELSWPAPTAHAYGSMVFTPFFTTEPPQQTWIAPTEVTEQTWPGPAEQETNYALLPSEPPFDDVQGLATNYGLLPSEPLLDGLQTLETELASVQFEQLATLPAEETWLGPVEPAVAVPPKVDYSVLPSEPLMEAHEPHATDHGLAGMTEEGLAALNAGIEAMTPADMMQLASELNSVLGMADGASTGDDANAGVDAMTVVPAENIAPAEPTPSKRLTFADWATSTTTLAGTPPVHAVDAGPPAPETFEMPSVLAFSANPAEFGLATPSPKPSGTAPFVHLEADPTAAITAKTFSLSLDELFPEDDDAAQSAPATAPAPPANAQTASDVSELYAWLTGPSDAPVPGCLNKSGPVEDTSAEAMTANVADTPALDTQGEQIVPVQNNPSARAPSESTAFGSTTFGSTAAGTTAFGSATFGSNAFASGSNAFGSNQFQSAPVKSDPFGSTPFGSAPFGSNSFGSNSFDSTPAQHTPTTTYRDDVEMGGDGGGGGEDGDEDMDMVEVDIDQAMADLAARNQDEPMATDSASAPQSTFATQSAFAPTQSAFAPAPSAFASASSVFAPVPSAFSSASSAFATTSSAFAPAPSAFGSTSAFNPAPSTFAPVRSAFAPAPTQSAFGSTQSAFAPTQSAFGQSSAFAPSQLAFGSAESAFAAPSQSAFGGPVKSAFSPPQSAFGPPQSSFGPAQSPFGPFVRTANPFSVSRAKALAEAEFNPEPEDEDQADDEAEAKAEAKAAAQAKARAAAKARADASWAKALAKQVARSTEIAAQEVQSAAEAHAAKIQRAFNDVMAGNGKATRWLVNRAREGDSRTAETLIELALVNEDARKAVVDACASGGVKFPLNRAASDLSSRDEPRRAGAEALLLALFKINFRPALDVLAQAARAGSLDAFQLLEKARLNAAVELEMARAAASLNAARGITPTMSPMRKSLKRRAEDDLDWKYEEAQAQEKRARSTSPVEDFEVPAPAAAPIFKPLPSSSTAGSGWGGSAGASNERPLETEPPRQIAGRRPSEFKTAKGTIGFTHGVPSGFNAASLAVTGHLPVTALPAAQRTYSPAPPPMEPMAGWRVPSVAAPATWPASSSATGTGSGAVTGPASVAPTLPTLPPSPMPSPAPPPAPAPTFAPDPNPAPPITGPSPFAAKPKVARAVQSSMHDGAMAATVRGSKAQPPKPRRRSQCGMP